ncbi:hypothetical protein PGTUg99_006071 [Puccinia graminis f. sp. tritici]|uniref:Inhibitor I9 domain-containing protein n=1 Tax=Puccinia graminis f. sp. tritici TaxID=56615 RepID=A0A5B0MCQ7_PUCGR|nr:hypothetical protein PGTUg99_006071 [Puccinia graminis f. sp. tritici]
MTHRLSAPFLIILMIAIVGLILPDLVHTTASYDAHQVSSQAKAQSVAPKGYNDREARPSSQKPGNGQEATSVYIITLKDNTTPAQFQAYRQQLIKQGNLTRETFLPVANSLSSIFFFFSFAPLYILQRQTKAP